MADIKVRFEVNPNAESEVLGDINNFNAELSNVSVKTNSSNVFKNIPTSESNGINALSFGQDLVFDEQGYLDNEDLKGAGIDSEQNPTEFVWGVVPESKKYSVKITFTNARDLKDIVVYGDKSANQFPTRAIIDSKTEIFSDDYRWAIDLQTESDTHTIEFTDWNRENYNACLTLVRVMLKYFEVDKTTGLKSVESLSQLTAQPKEIFYGIVPSDGSIEIVDMQGEIADMVKDGIIPNSKINVDIFANGKLVKHHLLSDSEYNQIDKTFSFSLTDNLSSLKQNQTREILPLKESLLVALKKVLKSAGYNDDYIKTMCSKLIYCGNGIDYEKIDTVENYLNRIYPKYGYSSHLNMEDLLNDICTIAQLRIIEDELGQQYFISARPRKIDIDERIISIPYNRQFSSLENDFIKKNSYTGIEYDKKIKEYRGITIDENYTFKENGSFVLEGIGDIPLYSTGTTTAKVIQKADGTSRLCFFKEISGNEIDVVQYCKYTLEDENGNTLEKIFNYPDVYSSSSTENFDFENAETITQLTQYDKLNSIVLAFSINISELTNSSKVNIHIYAQDNETSSEIVVYGKTGNIYNFSYSGNLLNNSAYLQDSGRGYYYKENMYKYICDTILNDYKDGIMTAKISVSCLDYYNENTKLVDWSKGETIREGDIVRIEKNISGKSAITDKNNHDIYFRVASKNFRNSGVPLIDLELQEIADKISNFELDSLETIISHANNGTAKDRYNVGDEKTIMLDNGIYVTLVILDFDYDALSDGSGKAKMSLAINHLYNGRYNFWGENDIYIGINDTTKMYGSSEEIENIFSFLPKTLQENIKSVDKFHDTINEYTKSEKLWMFSTSEINGNDAYQYWKTVRDGTIEGNRKMADKNTTYYASYWLRDANPYTGYYRLINASGERVEVSNMSSDTTTASLYLGFCL